MRQGPLPIVMSARIGEHQDRTRLVIELSDPVNLRAFALANPDRARTVLTQYRDVVHAAFFLAFTITVGVFSAAIAVSDTK